MYHVKDGKRTKESARLIVGGLHECLKMKKFESITVTDVQKQSTVGRATFYRLFDSVPDVLAYEFDEEFSKLMKSEELRFLSYVDDVKCFIRAWMQLSPLLETIISNNRHDIIFKAHERFIEPLRKNLTSASDMDGKEAFYMANILSGIMLGVITGWIAHGKKESAEELFDYVQKAAVSAGNSLHG